MAQRNKPWMDKWVAVDGLSASGGQGKVTFVEREPARGNDERFVLKVLKSQKDPDRRGRMHREVAALQSLEHAGIPRYVDSNASQFKDLDVPLFLVSEFIPGPTLEKYVTGTPVDSQTAIACVLKLLDADLLGICRDLSRICRGQTYNYKSRGLPTYLIVRPHQVEFMLRRAQGGLKGLVEVNREGWGIYSYTSDPV